MARPSNETDPKGRRDSYVAGDLDSAPKLVRLMKCKTKADIASIPI